MKYRSLSPYVVACIKYLLIIWRETIIFSVRNWSVHGEGRSRIVVSARVSEEDVASTLHSVRSVIIVL
jgi:hypothetical protein